MVDPVSAESYPAGRICKPARGFDRRGSRFALGDAHAYVEHFIDAALAASSGGVATVTRGGNPSWSWEPFPRLQPLNLNRNYLRVRQNLKQIKRKAAEAYSPKFNSLSGVCVN